MTPAPMISRTKEMDTEVNERSPTLKEPEEFNNAKARKLAEWVHGAAARCAVSVSMAVNICSFGAQP